MHLLKSKEGMTDKEKAVTNHSWLEEEDDGQLAIDVLQDDDSIIVIAPIAGVKKGDLDIAINDEMVTVKGTRRAPMTAGEDHQFLQECYWGPFSRNYILPMAVDSDAASASLKDGLLTIKIPKDAKTKAKSIKISDD